MNADPHLAQEDSVECCQPERKPCTVYQAPCDTRVRRKNHACIDRDLRAPMWWVGACRDLRKESGMMSIEQQVQAEKHVNI